MSDYGSDPVILEARPDRSWCQTGRQFAAGAAPATHRTAHGTDEDGQSYPGSPRRQLRPRRTWLSARRPAAKYENRLEFLIGREDVDKRFRPGFPGFEVVRA